ncbi:arsenite methyltransferase [Oleiharenicola lentus]|jgi:SAM-dependent methyltransferase|uniref:Arsenite methyltransferase n=1 Tax=Oleiharenicola lentus TaxID=2508720 RepID=A0A4Q1C7G3_9BACT|nr:arsenite methyltransferase [Oleiharenicola lentus]RXK54692.1 arsenite methyltransferase [Oleiharenicola lentus]
MKNPAPTTETIREYVRERYGAIAVEADAGEPAGCCGGAPKTDATACCDADEQGKAAGQGGCGCAPAGSADGCCTAPENYSAQLGYSAADLASVPAGADLGLGCGNPLAIASIKPGETVLDLGSGAGFDALLAARQLAGTGRVIGVDMTPAMVAKARRNVAKAGHANVEFRLGEIEALPVSNATVDLIISNCVVNLSPEKPRVFAEAFRVLKSGGRLALSDVVAVKPLPDDIRAQLPLIGACIGGATLVDELRAMLNAAGFQRVDIDLKGASRKFIAQWGSDPRVADYIVSAIITAWKP